MKIKNSEIEFTEYTSCNDLQNIVKDFKKLERPLGYITVNDGIILPFKSSKERQWGVGGVLNHELRFVEESMHPGFAKKNAMRYGGGYSFDESQIICSDESVIYIDPIYRQWGHFLVDSISRLWLWQKMPKMKIAFCGFLFKEGCLGEPYSDFFEALGIDEDQLIDIRKPTRFKRIFIPEMSYFADAYYSEEYLRIFDSIVEKINAEYELSGFHVPEKVYLSRCQFKGNGKSFREMGEKTLQDIFSYNGYTVVSPECLSFEQQVMLLSNCSSFASLSGTVAHNLLFARNLQVAYILNKTHHVQRQQYYLNRMKGIFAVNIDVFKEPFVFCNIPVDTGQGPFIVGVTPSFLSWAKKNKINLPRNLLYYRVQWIKNYVWLIFILPLKLFDKYLKKIIRKLNNMLQRIK